MRIDNPSVSGSLTFINGTNSISGDSVSLTGSLSGSFYGVFGGTSETLISGAYESASQAILTTVDALYAAKDNVSGSLGDNATLIRSLTAAGISGSLGNNAILIRSLTAAGISGSLGSNASLIRSLTAAGISGSFIEPSQSIASDINEKLNIADTGSFAKTTVDNVFGGTQTFGNIAVNGTGSFAYIESITGSAKIIGDAFIVVNSEGTGSRFAGLQVIDSGSATTSSLQWDSLANKWQYLNSGDVGYSGGGLLSGPRITGSQTVDDISYPTQNTLLRGQGGDHVYDSNITDDDTTVKIGINTQVTGSLIVSDGITGTLTGNASTATSASYASNASTADSATSSATATTASYALTAPYSGLVGSVPTWNQNTTGNAATATSASYAATGPFLSSYTETDTLATVTGRGATTSTALTLSGDLTLTSAGTSNSPTLAIDNPSTSAFIHSLEAFGANLTSGQHNLLVVGKEGNTKNSGYIGYTWAGDASNSNYVTIGHWGNDDLLRVYADGSITAGTNTIWHAGNDGPDSGLNADLLDGIGGDGYLRSNANDTYTGTLTTNGSIQFGNDVNYQLIMPPSHDKQKIGLYGPEGTGAEWIGTSSATLELSGTNINLNGANGSGTPTFKMGGTTIVDSSRNASFAGGTFSGTISVGASFVAGTSVAAGYYQDATNGAYRAITTSGTVGYYFQSYNGTGTKMYIGLAGSYDGRVGIGTTQPIRTLDVRGSSVFTDELLVNYADAITTIQGSTGYGLMRIYGNSGAVELQLGAHQSTSNAATIGTWSSSNLYFKTGNTNRVLIDTSGHVTPTTNGSQNLGSSSARWNTVYTSDLSMSNGIGDYTVVEGEEDLFLYNNKTGKTFKFMLQEVDPSTVPPKRK